MKHRVTAGAVKQPSATTATLIPSPSKDELQDYTGWTPSFGKLRMRTFGFGEGLTAVSS